VRGVAISASMSKLLTKVLAGTLVSGSMEAFPGEVLAELGLLFDEYTWLAVLPHCDRIVGKPEVGQRQDYGKFGPNAIYVDD
jgi:hypothetical protein